MNATDAGAQFGNLELISRWHGCLEGKNAKNLKLGGLPEAFAKKTKYEITQEVDKGYFFIWTGWKKVFGLSCLLLVISACYKQQKNITVSAHESNIKLQRRKKVKQLRHWVSLAKMLFRCYMSVRSVLTVVSMSVCQY